MRKDKEHTVDGRKGPPLKRMYKESNKAYIYLHKDFFYIGLFVFFVFSFKFHWSFLGQKYPKPVPKPGQKPGQTSGQKSGQKPGQNSGGGGEGELFRPCTLQWTSKKSRVWISYYRIVWKKQIQILGRISDIGCFLGTVFEDFWRTCWIIFWDVLAYA